MERGRLEVAIRDNDIPGVLELCRPRGHREPWFLSHADEMRTLVLKTKPRSAAQARIQMLYLCRLYEFGFDKKRSMTSKELLSPEVLEWFITSRFVSSHPQTRSTVRSTLRRIGRESNAHVYYGNEPERHTRRELVQPYSPHQVSGYLENRNKQSTEHRGRFLDVILHLGLGAGLRGPEMRKVRPEDIVSHGGLVRLNVEGDRARVLPVRTAYGEGLLRLAESTSTEFITGRTSQQSANAMSMLKDKITIPDWLPRLSVSRLRSTWMSETLSGRVEFKAFLAAAGLQSADVRSLAPHLLDVADQDVTDHALAGVFR